MHTTDADTHLLNQMERNMLLTFLSHIQLQSFPGCLESVLIKGNNLKTKKN